MLQNLAYIMVLIAAIVQISGTSKLVKIQKFKDRKMYLISSAIATFNATIKSADETIKAAQEAINAADSAQTWDPFGFVNVRGYAEEANMYAISAKSFAQEAEKSTAKLLGEDVLAIQVKQTATAAINSANAAVITALAAQKLSESLISGGMDNTIEETRNSATDAINAAQKAIQIANKIKLPTVLNTNIDSNSVLQSSVSVTQSFIPEDTSTQSVVSENIIVTNTSNSQFIVQQTTGIHDTSLQNVSPNNTGTQNIISPNSSSQGNGSETIKFQNLNSQTTVSQNTGIKNISITNEGSQDTNTIHEVLQTTNTPTDNQNSDLQNTGLQNIAGSPNSEFTNTKPQNPEFQNMVTLKIETPNVESSTIGHAALYTTAYPGLLAQLFQVVNNAFTEFTRPQSLLQLPPIQIIAPSIISSRKLS